MSNMAQRILEARLERKLTQDQLASLSGVAKQSIGNWEAGRNEPSRGSLLKLAAALGVTSEWLQAGAGQKHPTSLDVSITSKVLGIEGHTHRDMHLSKDSLVVWVQRIDVDAVSNRLDSIGAPLTAAQDPFSLDEAANEFEVSPLWLAFGEGKKEDRDISDWHNYYRRLHQWGIVHVRVSENDEEYEMYKGIQPVASPAQQLLRNVMLDIDASKLSDDDAVRVALAIQEAMKRVKT